jgi:translation initiation factor eIF-2B subunit beta
MSRVDKVILSTEAIMANGGLLTQSGAYLIAVAAQAHSVPVYVLGPTYKMTPLMPFDYMTYNEIQSPSDILMLEDHDNSQNIEAIVPAYDYVPAEFVSVYLTDHGGYTPKVIYRVF